jgi:cephalosporin-C deacetylase-like acetyl esterase
MRIRTDVDRIRTFIITSADETDHYGEMMKAYFRTEKSKIPLADYTGVTVAKWLPRRREILRKLAAAVGPFPARKVPLRARVNAKYDRGDYTVEGVSFYSRPDWPVSALFYLPKKARRPLPAVLLVHGHSYSQKAYPVYQKVAIHLAKNGYAVLAVDFVGGGERTCQVHENYPLYAAGMTVQGLMVWDNMRAVDYLSSRREVDPKRIGITGSSGGGNQTAFTTVFDQRIAASCPVNAVCMFDEHLTVGIDNFCSCEVIPGIWTFAEYSDLMATVAPRPLLISQSVKDRLFPIKGAREVVHRAREVYRAFGAPDNISIWEDYGPHSYSAAIRTGVIRWFDKHLKGIEPAAPETFEEFVPIEDEKSEVLFAFPGGKLPAGSGTLATILAEASDKLPALKRPRTAAAYRPYRRAVLAHLSRIAAAPEAPCPLDLQAFPPVETASVMIRPFSFQSEPGITIPSILIEPRSLRPSRVVIYAHPSGKARALDLRSVRALVDSGACVVALDLRGTGETAGHGPGEGGDFTLHRSIMLGRHVSMMRAYDICRAVDAAREMPGCARLPVYLWAEAESSMYALFAFALDARIKRFAAADLLLTFRSRAGFVQSINIFPPRILLGADVPDIIAASLDRRILLVRPELPAGPASSPNAARRVLAPASAAAKAAGLAPPKIVIGGYETADAAVRRFLLM